VTFRQLKDLVASWLDDLEFGYFTEAQVTVWINNAHKEVQKRLIAAGQNYYVKNVCTTLVVNQNEYVLPSNIKKIHRVELVISGTAPNESISSLTPITLNQKDLVGTGSGTPSTYTIKKNRIVLYPYPDSALSLRLSYSYLVGDMSLDTDMPDVPESYHELIALLACEDGFIKDGRVPELLEKKLRSYEKDMVSDANERRQDLSREVREVADYSGGTIW